MQDDKALSPFLNANRDPRWEPTYDAVVARLKRSGSVRGAPRVGETLDDFALPDLSGTVRRLSDLLADGPVVLSFNRGHWCGFCSQEIAAWQRAEPALAAADGRFVMISPEQGGRAAELAQLGPKAAIVLLDADMGLSLRLGLAVPIGADLLHAYLDADLDVETIYGGAGHLLPVPATFVVGTDRRIHFAHVDPDFRLRAEPGAVIACIASLGD